ncbi:solid-state culture-specific protein-like protein [Aspergillus ambiguus]|uniref:putative solid-state culture specific protein n=1 Tax=Aspergillus ambiguus TaxID=176160 RepID=UPI003CCE2762
MNAPESIVLDYTLADLYSADDEDHDICMVYAYAPPPNTQLAPHIPTLTHFPVQSPLCPAMDKHELAQTLFHVTAQRFGFCSGPMRILVLEPDSQHGHGTPGPSSQTDIGRVFSQLQREQRPIPTYARDLTKPPLGTRVQLAVTAPLDWFDHLPHVVDPKTHYNLLSKRGLAESGLPTPKTVVIDTVLSPHESLTTAEIQQEVTRMTDPIREHPLPFILKVPLVTSIGQGTFMVQTEADRLTAYATFVKEVKSMLLALSPANESLRPCNLILQEMMSVVDRMYCWSGGFISYHKQRALGHHYCKTMEMVARFLHRHGYFGPAGVDVMTNEKGNQLVVDLNVRMTGTYHLGPLRGHFTRCGFSEAAALATHRLKCTRAGFESHFANELRRGCVLVTAWVHAHEASLATITVAEEGLASLQALIQRVVGFAELTWAKDDRGSTRKGASKL